MRPVKNLGEAKERLTDIYSDFLAKRKSTDIIVSCYTPTWFNAEIYWENIQRYKRIVAKIIKAKLNDANDDFNIEKDCFIIWEALFGEGNDRK